MRYHHCRNLESVVYGEVKGNPEFGDKDYKGAYNWLEKELGFYPLFLAVGETEEDIRMTCYADNWRVRISTSLEDGKLNGIYTKKGEFPNYVLFSFDNVEGIFSDYDSWHLVLAARQKNYNMTSYEKRLLFKPSWKKSDWLRKARKEPGTVQIVTPKLYLPSSKRIWARNNETKVLLEKSGFSDIEVKRMLLQ